MIDLHCHILPGIDDGPVSIKDSVIMLNQAVKEGIDTIVVTPHRNSEYKATVDEIALTRDVLQRVIDDDKLPITLLLGQEIRIYGDLLADYLAGELFSMNRISRYILVEFATSDVPHYAYQLFYDMQCEGLVPIIAHPERNIKIMEQPDILYRLIEGGALSQVTASSVTGHFGKKIQKFTFQLLEANLSHFIASDAHDISYRDFRLREAFRLLRTKYSIKYTRTLDNNARILLSNGVIDRENPKVISNKNRWWMF